MALLGGQAELALAIVVVIVVNAIFSFAQEYRAERAVEALRRILPRAGASCAATVAEVARSPAEELVPGDVMLLDRRATGLGGRRAPGRAASCKVDQSRR